MKVLVANTVAPFIRGGAEILGSELVRQIERAGHEAEPLILPFRWDRFEDVAADMMLARSLRGLNADRVIALRFPAYLVQHRSKVVWLLHQFRQAYDLASPTHSFLGSDPSGLHNRTLIAQSDALAFGETTRVFTNSPVTQDRLWRFNGIGSSVLVPPLVDAEYFGNLGRDKYIFAGGRVNAGKRQHLLVEAMRFARGVDVHLVVAGPPDTPDDAERLKNIVRSYRLENVILDLRFLPRRRYAEYMNHALACAYLPIDEDSYGYVAMEAAAAGKPVLTAKDSGGVLGLVVDGDTGWVVDPDPEEIGRVIANVTGNPKRTLEMGMAAAGLWKSLDINWNSTLSKLLG